MSFTWNILDFGVSYYQAHQDANRVLIAEENRRRVFQNLVADIRDAYWRAAGAQLMKAKVDKILEDVKGPIAKSREVVAKSLLPPLPILREHKNLVNILRQLEALRLEADLATQKLAFLMGLKRSTKFKLVDLDEDKLALPKLVIANRSAASLGPAKTLSALENLALRGRSELRQEIYNERIDAAETKKAMLRLLPGLEISAAHNVDTNSFLANQTWGDLGVKVTFNLFNLLKGRSNIDFAETQEKVTHLRRLALNMAVLTQVNLSYRDYLASRKRLKRAEEVNNLDRKIHKIIQDSRRNKQKGVSEIDAIKAATEAVKTRLQRLKAYSDVQNSVGRIYVSIGIDMKPKIFKSNSISDIAEALRLRFGEIKAGSFGIKIPTLTAKGNKSAELTPEINSLRDDSSVVAVSMDAGVADAQAEAPVASAHAATANRENAEPASATASARANTATVVSNETSTNFVSTDGSVEVFQAAPQAPLSAQENVTEAVPDFWLAHPTPTDFQPVSEGKKIPMATPAPTALKSFTDDLGDWLLRLFGYKPTANSATDGPRLIVPDQQARGVTMSVEFE